MKKIFSKISALMLIFTIFSTGAFAASPKMSNWAKPAYDRLRQKQIIPLILRDADLMQEITRREFTHILMTYMVANNGYNLETYDADIKDVDDDKYIKSAYALGIVSGFPDGSFRPLLKIKRSEAAVMMYKAESLVRKVPDGSISRFKDARFIQTWAKKAVGAMTSLGVMSGYKNGIFSLTGNFNGKNLADKKVAVKFGEIVDFSDNFGFIYNVNSEIFGVLELDLIDENLLEERILKIKDGFLYNKFSAEKLAKIVKFNGDFEIKIEPNFMQIGEICVKF